MNGDVSRRAFDLNALARQGVKPLTFVLERRHHRRYLLLRAATGLQQRRQALGVMRGDRGRCNDRTVGIAAVGFGTEADGRAIGLVRSQQLATELGGIAETDR